jgi:hypothetical protein
MRATWPESEGLATVSARCGGAEGSPLDEPDQRRDAFRPVTKGFMEATPGRHPSRRRGPEPRRRVSCLDRRIWFDEARKKNVIERILRNLALLLGRASRGCASSIATARKSPRASSYATKRSSVDRVHRGRATRERHPRSRLAGTTLCTTARSKRTSEQPRASA